MKRFSSCDGKRVVFSLTLFVVMPVVVSGQGDPSQADSGSTTADTSSSNSDVAAKITSDAAKQYRFRAHDGRDCELVSGSLLRWSNPIAGELYGNVYLWTREGRPHVIGSVLQWFSPMNHGSHEFHSLSERPVQGFRSDDLVWDVKTSGVKFQLVPSANDVAGTSATRLRQVRQIARGFSIRKMDREGVRRDLRLLAQPIYRYGADTSDILDGALFVFVQGTDPEVFLLIQADKTGAKPRWRYALARMNSVQFVASYDGSEVWETEILPWGKVRNTQESYTSFGPFYQLDR